MAKCECCGMTGDDRVHEIQWDNKTISICFVCHFKTMAFGSSSAGICHECKEIKYDMLIRKDLNNNKICDACYLKILNSELNK